jgi:hypothetical protein
MASPAVQEDKNPSELSQHNTSTSTSCNPDSTIAVLGQDKDAQNSAGNHLLTRLGSAISSILAWTYHYLNNQQYLYVLCIHDCGGPPADLATEPTTLQQPLPHSKVFGIYDCEAAAKVALTEVVQLPEYAGRPLKVTHTVIEDKELGVCLGQAPVDPEKGGVYVVMQKMAVRRGR